MQKANLTNSAINRAELESVRAEIEAEERKAEAEAVAALLEDFAGNRHFEAMIDRPAR